MEDLKTILSILENYENMINHTKKMLLYYIPKFKTEDNICIESFNQILNWKKPNFESIVQKILNILKQKDGNISLEPKASIKFSQNINLLVLMFEFTKIESLLNLTLVSKSFWIVSQNQLFWKKRYMNQYGLFIMTNHSFKKYELSDKPTISWTEQFKRRIHLENNITIGKPIVYTIKQHKGPVISLCYKTGMDCFFSGGMDNNAIKCNLNILNKRESTGIFQQHHRQTHEISKELFFSGHLGPIWSIDLLDDILYTGCYDKTIKEWDVKTGKCLSNNRAHQKAVVCVSAIKDNQNIFLLSSSYDSSIKLWKYPERKLIQEFKTKENNPVYSVYPNFIQKEFVSGSKSTLIDLWDYEKGIVKTSFSGHTNDVNKVIMKDSVIVSAGSDNRAMIWDKRLNNKATCLFGHTSSIQGLDYIPEINKIATGSRDKTIKIWDNRNLINPICNLIGHTQAISQIQLEIGFLISCSEDETIRIWNFEG